jgi:hypothetical protein
MTHSDLPDFVDSPLTSSLDIDFTINEYLTRNGYFEKIKRLHDENRSLRKKICGLQRDYEQQRRFLVSLEVRRIYFTLFYIRAN